jgi:hypothetical protein
MAKNAVKEGGDQEDPHKKASAKKVEAKSETSSEIRFPIRDRSVSAGRVDEIKVIRRTRSKPTYSNSWTRGPVSMRSWRRSESR